MSLFLFRVMLGLNLLCIKLGSGSCIHRIFWTFIMNEWMLDFLKILLLPLIRLLCVPILESLYVIDCVYLCVLNQPCIYKVKLAWLSLQNFQYNTCKLNLKVRQMDHLWLSLTEEHFFRTIWFAMCFWIQSQSFFFPVRTIKVHQRILEFKEDTRKQLSELKENKLKKNKLLSNYQKKMSTWV